MNKYIGMPISYYRVLQPVLTQTRDVICRTFGVSEQSAFEKAEAFIKENSARWRLPNPDIKYMDPFCRIAYVYMNVALHANLVYRAISHFPELRSLLHSKIANGEEVRMCALGGGPGSELLGVVRYIQDDESNRGKSAYLDFILVDQIREWDESWHALKRGIDEQFRSDYGIDRSLWPANISKSFLPLDATSLNDFVNFATRFYDTDLFICSYLISEIGYSIDGFKRVLDLLMQRAASGALVLFIDRNEKVTRDKISSIVASNELLEFVTDFKERGRLTDNMRELGEWYINIPSLPRQTWLTYFQLARRK